MRQDFSDTCEIRREQVRTVARQIPLSGAGSAIAGIMSAALFYYHIHPGMAVWLWVAALLGLQAFEYYRFSPYHNDPASVDEDKACHHDYWLAHGLGALNGLLWGGTAAFQSGGGDIGHAVILGGIATGAGLAGALTRSVMPGAAMAFLIFAVGPHVLVLSNGTDVGVSLLVFSVLFLLMTAMALRGNYRRMRESVLMRIENGRLLRRLNDAQETLLDAIASSSEAFALFDPDGRLLLCNENFGSFLSLPPGVLKKGVSYQRILENASRPQGLTGQEYHQWLREMLSGTRHGWGGEVVELENGHCLKFTGRPMANGGVVAVLVDITAIREREKALLAAKNEAESASRAKSDFLALMSHELRTPLNAIMGFSEIIKDEMFGAFGIPAYREYAADIHASGRHLLSVINDILDLSKIEAGRFDLQEQDVDVPRLIAEVTRMLQGRAEQGRLDVRVQIQRALPSLHADPRCIKQMLVNLLSNAIKFTPSGGTVTISAHADENGFVLEVSDTGIGISKEDMAKVLEPFGQVDRGLARKQQGTGLGVPLVRSLMELHNGHLQIESEPGVGTTISLHFGPGRVIKRDAA